MAFPLAPGADLQISPGRGGAIRLEPHLYISDSQNHHGTDIIADIIDISITHDLTRSSIDALQVLMAGDSSFSGGATWILDATISLDGWQRLRPFVDWLAPVLTVWYADGSSLTHQLGHYLVLDSPEERAEIGGTVRLDARDTLWVLSKQGIPDILIAPTGLDQGDQHATLVNWTATIKKVISDTLVPGGDATTHLRENVLNVFALAGLDGPIFDIGTPRLDVINGLLLGAGQYPLYVTETGLLDSMAIRSTYFTTPIRRWLANPPPGSFMLGADLVDPSPRERERSPIAETIQSTPLTADLIDQIIVVGGGINRPIYASASVSDQYATTGKGRDLYRIVNGRKQRVIPTIPSQQAAQQLANWLIEQALTENTSLTLNLEPDPTFVSIHNTVTLGIWDALGRQIANGVYVVKRVKYGMLPESPLMQVDVAAFDNLIPNAPF